MKHLAQIQSEFLKEAAKWDELSIETQRQYLRDHPDSKKKLTARLSPKQKKMNLKKLVKGVWDDDVSYEEATKGFTGDQLRAMRKTIAKNPGIFNLGVPFKEADKRYAELLKTDEGARLIKKMVDNIEGPEDDD